jgi:uncharacterized protein (TIGR02284 family)
MIGTGNDVSTLNSLIETTIDSIDGYRESAQATSNGQLKAMFENLSNDRTQAVETLRARVRDLGGTPEDDGTVLAAAHRKFVDLKAMVTGRDDKAIINEVERGEDHIKAKFEGAMKDDEIPGVRIGAHGPRQDARFEAFHGSRERLIGRPARRIE